MIHTPHRVRETAAVSGHDRGEWTYADYAAMADDGQRYEIMDGQLIMSPSPGSSHQEAGPFLASALRRHAVKGTRLFLDLDTELAAGVVVRPDVLLILPEHRPRITSSRIIGAPDLIVEIASPGTATYDRREKYDAYARSGVREYWIADPIARAIEVFTLAADGYRSLGVFADLDVPPSLIVPGFATSVGDLLPAG